MDVIKKFIHVGGSNLLHGYSQEDYNIPCNSVAQQIDQFLKPKERKCMKYFIFKNQGIGEFVSIFDHFFFAKFFNFTLKEAKKSKNC